MSTQTDLAAVQAAVAKAKTDLAAVQSAVIAASNGANALVNDLTTITTDLTALANDITPTPPPPPSGTAGFGQTVMSPPVGFTTAQMILDEKFPGTSLNTGNWNQFYGPGTPWNNRGALPSPYTGGNTPLSTDVALYNPSQNVVNNGLSLTAVPYSGQFASMGYQWLSGVITSKFTLPTGEFYVQVRAKMPSTAAGMWPAIWFLPGNGAQEFDGFEGGWTGSSPNNQGHSDIFALSGEQQTVWNAGADMSAGFHTYGHHFLAGSPGKVTTYFDGNQVYNISTNLSQESYYLFLQLQVAGSQTSGWHTTGGSATGVMQVAEVQVYS